MARSPQESWGTDDAPGEITASARPRATANEIEATLRSRYYQYGTYRAICQSDKCYLPISASDKRPLNGRLGQPQDHEFGTPEDQTDDTLRLRGSQVASRTLSCRSLPSIAMPAHAPKPTSMLTPTIGEVGWKTSVLTFMVRPSIQRFGRKRGSCPERDVVPTGGKTAECC